jgi:DNA-directed RNA polymerase specialized sigma24 family protein
VGWQQQVALRIGRGESAALGQLYDRLAERIYRIAVVMTSSIAVAEQITEAVFVEAWHRPEVLLRQQHQLENHLIHEACQKCASWRAAHSADHPRRVPTSYVDS